MQNKYKNFLKFILFTFLISWISWGLLIVLKEDIFILRVLGAYGPLLSLTLLILLNKDRILKNRLLKSLRVWKVNIWWYIFAIFATAIVAILAVLINNLLFEPVSFTSIDPIFILIAIPYVLITSVLGEEAGWRGYALNFLNKSIGSIKGSIILGTIWGLWHLPLFYISTDFHQSIPFLLFLAQCIFMTFIYTWIYARTKSLLIQHLFHTLSNISIGLLPLIPSMNGGNQMPLIIAVSLLGVIAVILVLKRTVYLNIDIGRR